MKALLIFGTLFVVAYGSIIINTIKSGENKELKYVGTADGKAYFFENITLRTWTEAGEYCNSANMQLASISSESQLTLLKSTTIIPAITDLWTAGRDAHDIRQFTWNDTKLAVPELVRGNFNVIGGYHYQTCISIRKFSANIELWGEPCIGKYYTLCST